MGRFDVFFLHSFETLRTLLLISLFVVVAVIVIIVVVLLHARFVPKLLTGVISVVGRSVM